MIDIVEESIELVLESHLNDARGKKVIIRCALFTFRGEFVDQISVEITEDFVRMRCMEDFLD